ncbi:aspartic proteinase CDR1-like [Salvia divinorum]|uniref:Aspartic proteinase CDR1-like n=1 Tax=Salvia divinorum TaxID=28513 RepID=A0ABD1FVK9_SALDI
MRPISKCKHHQRLHHRSHPPSDRDSPDSPLSDPSLPPWRRLTQAKQRSLARASSFTDRLMQRKSIESTINRVQGTYLIRFSIGAPPHHTIAIMDTGSQLISTQCEPCTKCMRQLFPIFSPGSSTTYKEVRCDSPRCGTFGHESGCDDRREKCVYNVRYGDSSYSSGAVATETFTFAESRGEALHYFNNIQFGCGHSNYFHFASTIPSGIVGLSAGKSSLLSQFGYDRFSYCLTTYGDRKKGSKLHFGEDAYVTGRTMVWTPMTEMAVPDFYFVRLEAISVGNKRIEYHNPALVEGRNIVMDSGGQFLRRRGGGDSKLDQAKGCAGL